MTNNIQSAFSIDNSIASKAITSKQSFELLNTGFSDLFTTLISDMNSLSISDNSGLTGSSDLMTPLLMLMFTKLFGDEATTSQGSVTPQGLPINGVLTQTSHEGHVALDFGVAVGTNVKTTMQGTVTYAGWNNEGYGNLVIVENGDYKTYYAHLSSIPVNLGQTVSEGDIIGLSGNTGNSTGPHLHYEIRKNGVAINPLSTLSNY